MHLQTQRGWLVILCVAGILCASPVSYRVGQRYYPVSSQISARLMAALPCRTAVCVAVMTCSDYNQTCGIWTPAPANRSGCSTAACTAWQAPGGCLAGKLATTASAVLALGHCQCGSLMSPIGELQLRCFYPPCLLLLSGRSTGFGARRRCLQ